MPANPGISERSYGCTFGCGNPYDFILVSVRDGTTEFLCVPCMIRLASDMVEAITNPDSPAVAEAMANAGIFEQPPMPAHVVKGKGHNAPATNLDPDLFDSYDSVITEDELPEAFR